MEIQNAESNKKPRNLAIDLTIYWQIKAAVIVGHGKMVK
jgi:hypothetical protein